MLGGIGGRRRRGWQRMSWLDGTTDWVNSGSWWWTGRPGVRRFMGSQRVGDDLVTELNWTELSLICSLHFLYWISKLWNYANFTSVYISWIFLYSYFFQNNLDLFIHVAFACFFFLLSYFSGVSQLPMTETQFELEWTIPVSYGKNAWKINKERKKLKDARVRNSPAVQRLELCALTAEGPGSIPAGELRSPKPLSLSKRKKKILEWSAALREWLDHKQGDCHPPFFL